MEWGKLSKKINVRDKFNVVVTILNDADDKVPDQLASISMNEK